MFAASILNPLYQLVSTILAAFYQVTSDYSVAIGLLTLVIMIVVMPLTLKSTKSMLEMQRIQPEVKKLQEEHRGDVQKRNEAMMALYKEHGVNPLGGCVPMLLPLPIFIVMYRTIHGLTRLCSDKLTAQPRFNGLARDTFCPDHIKESAKLFKSLVGHKEMLSFGLDLAKPAASQIRDGFVRGLPYLVLVLIVAATSYYQQRQVTVRSKNQPVNPQQQMLLRIMPAGFGIISLFFPAALIVYFLVQNLFRIIQNAYITNRFYGDGGLGHQVTLATAAAASSSNGAKPGKDKPKGKGAPEVAPAKVVPPSAKKQRPQPRSSAGNGRPMAPDRPRPDRPRPTPKPKKP